MCKGPRKYCDFDNMSLLLRVVLFDLLRQLRISVASRDGIEKTSVAATLVSRPLMLRYDHILGHVLGSCIRGLGGFVGFMWL